MKKVYYAFSAVLIAVAAVFYFYADTFKTLPGQKDIGPAAFPKMICILLAISAVALLVTERRSASSSEEADTVILNKKLVISVGTAIVYFLLLRSVGFIPCSIVAVFIMELLLLEEPFKKAWPLVVGVAILSPIILYIIFDIFLKVPLPAGILAGILK